jgi:subtilisin family serine protease
VTRRFLPVGAVVAAALVAGACGAGQEPAPPAAAPDTVQNTVLPADRTYTVTLLTGDVVTVNTRKSGCPGVRVEPAEPNGGYRTSCGPDGHVHVVPGSAAPLIGRVLDEDLFDVTTLIKEGYDDASSADLPLIMRGGQTTRAALAGQRALPSIGAVAGRQPKAGAADFVAKLTDQADQARSADGPQVWLDHRVRSTQDTSTETAPGGNMAQVKAPQAWASGHTGEGVRIAVLDSGVDPTHPDLAGKIVEQADFTVDGGDAVDRFGHGTHVASIAAGVGGAHSGVAPDAQLVVGKVLDDQGNGYESQVIAGMEWAAPRAKVVNMSLGGDPSDGTDPASQAIDELTRKHGTLFVVSAGNFGPYPSSVTAPGTAPAALTVGAVDARDTIAPFSSRGPVFGTRALKPEIVAPGVDIVAARAAGTTLGTPVDARYIRLSGTSMAAPHVAGAAADLAQAHPDWDASRLKAALVGAVDPAKGGDPYEVGAGRLNVARALGGVVSGTATVDLGTLAHPQSGTAEAKVGWTNTGAKAVRLALSVRVTDRYGKTSVDPAVTLDASTVTVPANGTATAVVRLDRAKLGARPGLYTAVVTATWPGGGTSTTPVSYYVEPPSYELTVTSTAPPDTAKDSVLWAFATVINLDDPAVFHTDQRLDADGVLRLRVPAGRYSVMGSLQEMKPGERPGFYELRRLVMAGDPDVAVTADTTAVLDAAAAKPVVATVDGQDTDQAQSSVAFIQHPRRGVEWSQVLIGFDEIAREHRLYATPTEGTGIGSFQGYQGFSLDSRDGSTHYNLIRTLPGRVPDDIAYRVTAAEQAQLARIDQRFLTADAPGAQTSHRRGGESEDGLWLIDEDWYTGPPPTRVDYVSPNGVWTDIATSSGVGATTAAFVEPRQRYAAGSRQEKVWARQPLRPDWYGGGPSMSDCLPKPVTRTSTLLRVDLVDLTDQHDRFTCLARIGQPDWLENTRRTMTLYRNGQVVGSHQDSYGEFTMPKEKADYRLTYDLDASAVLPVSTKVSTAWTFTSAANNANVPLLSVDYALPLDQNNHPTTGEVGFTVRQAPGTAAQKVTEFKAWTSLDDGATWTPADVRKVADNRFSARLPETTAGQAVSLRVAVAANGGSGMEQTIIRAYRDA